MVTIESLTRIGLYSWLLKYSSDLPEPTFYIYLDGNLITETQQTEYAIAINMDESSVIEVLDDADAQPMQIFPGKLRLGWFFVEGTDYYRIDEYINSNWVERYRLSENGGYMSWPSQFLEDGQTHQFRVVPVGTNGNEGRAKEFAVLMVRRPDVPDVNYDYSESTKQVIIYDTDSPPAYTYHVTGTITPDATGNYEYGGIYNGQPYHKRTDNSWFIWYYGGIYDLWVITSELGVLTSARWYRSNYILGDYGPQGEASGTATVAQGGGNF